MSERPSPAEPSAHREERKVVTALFADLVGSTALATALDPEEVRLVVGEAVGRIVTEVERLGGHVKDLAGDGVLAFFGAPVSSEDDPERAVRSGLAVLEEIAAYAREVEAAWGISAFGVRVGIATGPVVLGTIGAGSRVEYAAFGDTVNVAARLQAAATPGALLVDEATYRLATAPFTWDGPRLLELKGKPEPVRAFEATGLGQLISHGRGVEGAAAPLVGREAELAAAAGLLDRLRVGTGGTLLVTGEAGIGKSRLLRELRGRASEQVNDVPAVLWLEGRCVSYGEPLPWWPVRDLLRDWLGVALDDPDLRVRVALRRALEDLFGADAPRHYPYLATLLDLSLEREAAAQLEPLSPEALQYRTFEVVGALLERLAADRPVVVAIEDLHWADATSVQQLERLLPLAERSAVLLALAQREDRDHPSWRLLEVAERDFPHVTVLVSLQPLGKDAETTLLHALIDEGTLPVEFEQRILAAADGNPFFLEELVRSLDDAGALVRDDGRWRFDHEVAVELPPTIEKLIVARIDRLPTATRDVLAAASALGRRFGLELLTHVAGVEGLEEALHQLQRLDLLRFSRRWPQPELRFKHALIQEAAYRTLLASQRRVLHRRAADWLERRHAQGDSEPLGLLAHHWLAAEDEEKAVDYLLRAGDRARAEWALDEAVEHYRALLPLLERRGDDRTTALTLFRLGLAQHMSLRFAEASASFERAFSHWAPPRAPDDATATLRVATNALPREPDPPRSYTPTDIRLQMALFDRLVERWPESTFVPWLAERWEIADDGLRYLFHLRTDVRWSDGTPLTAHDVEYGIKRNLDPARPGISVSLFYVLEGAQDYVRGRAADPSAIGVCALDDHTVEFRLVAPAPYFLALLNRPDAGPQPRHAIEAASDRWTEPARQIVSGAFRLEERTDDRVLLVRREDALPRPGNVGRVEIVARQDVSPDEHERGAFDLVIPSVTAPMSDLLQTAGPDVTLGPPAMMLYLAFDHRDPRWGDRDARLALAHALDREQWPSLLPPTLRVATGGLVPPALQGHTPEIAPRFDPERARALAGQRSPFGKVVLAVVDSPTLGPLVESVVGGWRDVLGLDAGVHRVSPSVWAATAAVRDLGALFFSAWFPGYPDPEYFLRLLLHSESTDNLGGWSNAAYDRLIQEARLETDGVRRLELFHTADRMAVAEEAAVIPLVYGSNPFVPQRWLEGWWEHGKSWSGFADLRVDDEKRERRRGGSSSAGGDLGAPARRP